MVIGDRYTADGLSSALARWINAMQPSVSFVVPYRWKWRCAFCAKVCAAEVAPNGISHPALRPDDGMILPCLISSLKVASHSVRKHNTWRAGPPATASIAAITEPPGPKVSIPPLCHVGRTPSAASKEVTPPSPQPPRLPPPG